MNKKLHYIYENQEYQINLYTEINTNNYIRLYIDEKIMMIPLVENDHIKASHIKIYKNNHIYALAYSI